MSKVPAGQHLKELRTRFFIVAIFFIIGASLAYAFQGPVIEAVLAPLHGQKLVYLNPAGGFSFIFMVSIYSGVAIAFPLLIQQLYAFVRPALPETAQQKSSMLIIGSFLLLIAGMAFGYFVAVPNALVFLYSFADKFIDASLTADSYLNFVIAYTIGIGIVFQIPLLLLLINSIKPFTPGGLMKSEKWVIVISFIVAAIITPTPDPINQTIIAGPVVVVYQIGVIIILASIFKKYRVEKKLRKKELRVQRLSKKRGMVAVPASDPEVYHAPTPLPTPHQAPRPAFKPAPQFADIKPQPKPVQLMQPTRPRSMDGFVRPTHHQVVVPKRVQPQPAARALPRPASPNQRNFTIDGMYRPFQSQTIQ
ncbi:MAG: Sec-independent protein translocase subunit TatC, sec-independent protein translocase protein TatC [Candidatus Saccharibacteria bacterium]|nr:Sec-independent protein translocase subunit TatC, sec-independent protein translocase protein TatC [Candidatus Saccharibacteria bacterium]MDB5180922.1 Sec-independent protein translocase subunit TatC, sec-independent protein translocase protein TatC [Candidatus Saccharibacteria bacterium]